MSEIATGTPTSWPRRTPTSAHQIVGLLETRLLDGDRDRDELHRRLREPGRRAGPGDQGVAGARTSQEELGHAQRFAQRIKELYGVVPGSEEFGAEQSYLQPPEHQTDVVHVIKGVIAAETGAIEHYSRIIEETEASTRSPRT